MLIHGAYAQRVDATGLGTGANDQIGVTQIVTGMDNMIVQPVVLSAYLLASGAQDGIV